MTYDEGRVHQETPVAPQVQVSWVLGALLAFGERMGG